VGNVFSASVWICIDDDRGESAPACAWPCYSTVVDKSNEDASEKMSTETMSTVK